MTVWSEIQPLKSVVLGNVFKTDDLLSCLNLSEKWAAPFREINQKAEQELDSIAELLNDFRIIVYRPKIYNIKSDIGLVSPPLSPRDWLLSYGDEVLVGNEASLNHHVRTHSTDHLIKDPLRMPHHDRWSDIAFNNLNDASLARPYLHMANVIRCGMDVFLTQHPDTSGNKLGQEWIIQKLKNINKDVRIHMVNCESHLDGYIFLVKPGLMLSSLPKSLLPDYFAKWDVIIVDEKVEVYRKSMLYKWKKLNPIVAAEYAWFLQSNPAETMFSINGLLINDSTVMLPGRSPKVFRELDKRGINCISVDMRALSYWDSGLHCCTSELERQGGLEDYS